MLGEAVLAMSPEELREQLQELQNGHSNLRFQKALQQLEGTHQLGQTRKDIARIKTLLRQYELGIRTRKAE